MNNLFSGVKILDCTRVFSWPFASRYFSDYWAEVLKIETERNYDEARKFSPIIWDKSLYFEILNRWKKSLYIDFKKEKDLNLFYELVKDADIFLENFSANVKNKLKINYEILSKINSKLIYWSLNWYWENSDKKAYDSIIQAESGFSSLSWIEEPMKNATAIIDAFSGTNLVLAVSSLLYKREKTGFWGFVNIPMIASGIQLLEQNLTQTSINWKNPDFVWNWDNAIFPFGFFKAKDWNISIAIWNEILWNNFKQTFLNNIKWDYNSNQERLNSKDFLKEEIEKKFSEFSIENLSKLLTKWAKGQNCVL